MGGACVGSNPELPKLSLPRVFSVCIAHTLMLHNLAYIQIISGYTVSLSRFLSLSSQNSVGITTTWGWFEVLFAGFGLGFLGFLVYFRVRYAAGTALNYIE